MIEQELFVQFDVVYMDEVQQDFFCDLLLCQCQEFQVCIEGEFGELCDFECFSDEVDLVFCEEQW